MRFGLSEVWTQTTIGKIAKVVGGGTPETEKAEYWNGNIQWFTPSEVGQTKYIEKSERTISVNGLNKSSAKLLPIGTLLLSTRATVGECSIALNECTTNQGFQSLIASNTVNNEFLYYLIATKKRHFVKYACGSTFLEISNKEVVKTKIFVPQQKEQEKIATFLSKIDERIETQSKIIEDLELVKKGIYNHIFTQLNSVEKVLLEDLLIDFNKRTLTDKQYPILSSTLSGIYLQEDYFNKQAASATTEGYKIVPYGFATYRSMSDTGEFRFNLQTIVENGIVSPAYPVFTCIENYRLDFILFCLNYYDDIKKQIFSMKQGGTRLALHFNSLCKLYIPQIDKEKQSKIMAIVNSYDAKIVVEKQVLGKLKEQKKFLLSNMFI